MRKDSIANRQVDFREEAGPSRSSHQEITDSAQESGLTRFNPINKESMRHFHESIVLNLIRDYAPISRRKLARSIGLNESTISSIVKGLVEAGLVYEDGLGKSTGGRKPRLLRLDGKRSVTVGVTIGVDKTTIALSTFAGRIFHKTQFPTHRNPESFLSQLTQEIRRVLNYVDPEKHIEGFGISLPGLVDTAQGKVIYSSNLNWRNVTIAGALIEEFGLTLGRDLFFEDDVRAAALAQVMFGDLKECRHGDAVSILINEGLGTGIIIGGQLYCGYNLGAGQFGHVSLQHTGPKCGCGNRGCWEVYCSDPATIQRYLSYLSKEEAETSRTIGMDGLIRLARQGNSKATKALLKTATYLGRGISIVINSLNPEVIVLNGYLSKAWDLIEAEVLRVVQNRALQPNLENLRIVPSSIKENSCLIGAVSLVLSKNFVIPKIA
ncbi:MAG TPA: ROK family transcriptional regulator [Acidobacteriota bacterium]|nr:ROK family transcriptional regulator [Acidobacteriota bacterium]